MTAIFFDTERETYRREESVLQINSGEVKENRHVAKCWVVIERDNNVVTLPKRRYRIERIEG